MWFLIFVKPAPRVQVYLCLTVDKAKPAAQACHCLIPRKIIKDDFTAPRGGGHGGQAGAYMFAWWGTNRSLSRHYNCKCADVLRPSAQLTVKH